MSSRGKSFWIPAAVLLVVVSLVIGLVLPIGRSSTSTSIVTTEVTTTTATTSDLTSTSLQTVTTIETSTLTRSVTLTDTVTSTTTSTYVPPSVLQLQVTLNATTVVSGHSLGAKIDVFNPLNENVSVFDNATATFGRWNAHDFDCNLNPTWGLAAFAVLQGHYASGNVSSSTPLMLFPGLPNAGCPPFTEQLTSVVVLPNGTEARDYGIPGPQSGQYGSLVMNPSTIVCNNATSTGQYDCVGSGLNGYWTIPAGGLGLAQNATTSSPYFHYFQPGEYTIVAATQWGQSIYSYFEVVSA